MKHSLQLKSLTIALAVLLFTLAASAHTYSAVSAKIPFKFTVGKRTFQPGEYRFVAVGTGLLALMDSQPHVIAVFTTGNAHPSTATDSSQLTFKKENTRFRLARITMDKNEQEVLGDEAVGYQLPKESLSAYSFAPSENAPMQRLLR